MLGIIKMSFRLWMQHNFSQAAQLSVTELPEAFLSAFAGVASPGFCEVHRGLDRDIYSQFKVGAGGERRPSPKAANGHCY